MNLLSLQIFSIVQECGDPILVTLPESIIAQAWLTIFLL